MSSKWIVALMAASFCAGAVHAAQEPPAEKDAARTNDANIEASLKAARERLQAAAKEVAELSSQLASPAMDHFMSFNDGGPRRALIGVQLDPKSGKEGARIVEVSPGGAAAEAGVRAGDVIVSLNGEKISSDNSSRDVFKRMRDVEPQSKVKLRVMRDGKPRDFEIAARPSRGFVTHLMPAMPAFPGAPMPPPGMEGAMPLGRFMFGMEDEVSGMELATLTPALGRYFGTEKGVLVVRAPEGESFKLEDGDVILAIGGREPKSGWHATRILRSYQPGEKIDVKLMRLRKTTNLEVTVPENREDIRRTRILGPEEGANMMFEMPVEPGQHIETIELDSQRT